MLFGPNLTRIRCKLATAARTTLLLLAAGLSGCATSNNESITFTDDRGIANQPFPANYRSDLLALLRTYLNDPRGVREASIADPVQREVGGRRRYIACLRYNARDTSGAYSGTKERFVMFIDGRLDRIVEKVEDLCEGARYAPFPELEKLTR